MQEKNYIGIHLASLGRNIKKEGNELDFEILKVITKNMIILTKYRTNSLRICVCTMMNMSLVFYYKNLCQLIFFIFAKIVSFVLVMILDYHLICSCFCLLILCVAWWSLIGVWDFALWERDWWGFSIEGLVEYVLFRLYWIIIFLHQNQGLVLDPHQSPSQLPW